MTTKNDAPPEPQRHPSRRLPGLAALLVVALLAVVSIFIVVKNESLKNESQKRAHSEDEGRAVEVVQVKRSEPTRQLVLIGETRPYFSVTLFARVSGYLKGPIKDVGDVVEQDEILARVDSPESELAFHSAQADELNKRRVASRMKRLLAKKLVSPQEAEQTFAASDIATATLRTQEVIRDYQRVKAPFSGIISQRFLDPGALIQNASASQSASQPLFILSQISRVRIFAYVSQQDAPLIAVGDAIQITVPEQASAPIDAKISRLAAELDPKTRTLLTETILENPLKKIVPGSFVQVKINVKSPTYLELPSNTLVMRGKDAYVPTVAKDSRIHYSKIEVVEDDGIRLLIRSGVEEGERVAINLGNSMQEGQKVKLPEARVASIQIPQFLTRSLH